MKVELIYNPRSGNHEWSEQKLKDSLAAYGFECIGSTDVKRWGRNKKKKADFLVVAGGDGTVKKVIGEILKRKDDNEIPIAILPLGTANNFARSLGLDGHVQEVIQSWQNRKVILIDVGVAGGKSKLFIEAIGVGVFPLLMKKMERKGSNGSAEGELQLASHMLYKIILSYPAKQCIIETDNDRISGKFLLVEVMNTKSIGPNLQLANGVDMTDGLLDVVMVPKEQRKEFGLHVLDEMNGKESAFQFQTVKSSKVKITWKGSRFHVDDKRFKWEAPITLKASAKKAAIKLLW